MVSLDSSVEQLQPQPDLAVLDLSVLVDVRGSKECLGRSLGSRLQWVELAGRTTLVWMVDQRSFLRLRDVSDLLVNPLVNHLGRRWGCIGLVQYILAAMQLNHRGSQPERPRKETQVLTN